MAERIEVDIVAPHVRAKAEDVTLVRHHVHQLERAEHPRDHAVFLPRLLPRLR
jgi:hypothetical protein